MVKDASTRELTSNASMARKAGVLLLLLGIVLIAVMQFREVLSLQNLAKHENQLRVYQAKNPILIFGVAFCIYVVVTGLSLPGASAMTLVYGWYFGMVHGIVLVSFASTTGASVAFLLSRYLFRDAIQSRFGERLVNFNESLAREGPFFLFTLRLIPAVPFFVINAVMGLTPIRTRTFWWISQLGMFPATCVFVYAGSSVPNLRTLADEGVGAVFTPSQLTQIIAAFVILGLFPLIVRLGIRLTRRQPPPPQL